MGFFSLFFLCVSPSLPVVYNNNNNNNNNNNKAFYMTQGYQNDIFWSQGLHKLILKNQISLHYINALTLGRLIPVLILKRDLLVIIINTTYY